MSNPLTRRGYDQDGFVLELRFMSAALGYTQEVEYTGEQVPLAERECDAPRARYEVTAILLTTTSARASMRAVVGGDTYESACQGAALLMMGMLHQRYHDELRQTPYRYHPRRLDPAEYSSFRGTSTENNTTIVHLARMVEAYDRARVDLNSLAGRGIVQNNHEILRLRQENLGLQKELDKVEQELRELKLSQGMAAGPSKLRRVPCSMKITARKSTSRPLIIRESMGAANFLDRIPHVHAPCDTASAAGSSGKGVQGLPAPSGGPSSPQ